MRSARTVLRRSGFEGFKIQLVLRETGFSARTFYRHFPDKDSLIVALIQDEYAATARRLTAATAAAGDDPEAQVSAWIRELLLATSHPALERRTRLFSTHYLAMSRFPDAAAKASLQVIQPLAEAIARGQERGVFQGSDATGDAVQTARLVGGALNEVLAQRPGPAPIDDVVDTTTDFALRALRVPGTLHPKR